MPSLYHRSTFALPPYQSRCKVGAKSVKGRFKSVGSASFVRRKSGITRGLYRFFLLFVISLQISQLKFGESRKIVYLCNIKSTTFVYMRWVYLERGACRSTFINKASLLIIFHMPTSYDPPMFLLTKLDEALILYKRKSGGSSSLVPWRYGGR